ncbi:MAG: GntR family transcriptional regulator [Balneolaceae bacterium]
MGINFQDSTPLYVQIVNDIHQKISSGKLQVGQQLKSHKQLAKEYDVSLITIKSALSNLIDDGVLFSRVGKGTFVAKENKERDFSSHSSIGLVLQDLKNPFFSLIAHMVEETAYSNNYNLLLSNSSSQIKKEEAQINHFQKLGVNGMIVATLRKEPHAPEIIRKLHNQNYPYVMVSYVADKDIYFVGTDHEKGAYMGTEHLISQGHQKIGYINSPVNNSLGDVRMEGYKRALVENNIEYHEAYHLRISDGNIIDSFKAGTILGDSFHALPNKPTAYFTYNDLTALGFIKRIQELGYEVPGDIAIVGFDDIEQAEYAQVPLTTIHQQVEKIGATAIDKLIQLIEGKNPEVQTVFAPTLVIRESCGAMQEQHNDVEDDYAE